MSTVDLVIHIRTRAGHADQQLAAFSDLAPLVRAEEGCLRYELFSLRGRADEFLLVESWASQADLDRHDVAPHMLAADAANHAFRTGPADVFVLDPVGAS
jgi:quinol monooxygenase YgiN